ncbi:MAG TPA: hypothetical protein DCP28_30350, partial [Cytophagales bacterium]|nr:hypothetical protein [Cytophagales bacterium]
MQHPVTEELIAQSQRYLDECLGRVGRCLDEITEEEVWKRPNANSNSMGNLVIHLQGNITQYIISSLGGAPDLRERDAEFAATEGADKATLWAG